MSAAATGGTAPLRGVSRAAAVLASHSRHASADAGAVGAPHFEQRQRHGGDEDDEDDHEDDEEEEEQQHEEEEEQTDGNIGQQQEDEGSVEDQQELADELQRSSLADHDDAHAGAEPDDQQQQNDDNAEPAGDGEDFEDNEDDGEGSGSGGATTSNELPIIADDGANRDDSGAVDTSSVYAAFGRDTAAGRALFKLYNKNKTHYAPGVVVRPRVGGPLDPQQEAERLRRIEAERLKKPKYKAPQLKRAPSAGSGLDKPVGRVPLGGGKKTVEVIERERARDAHLYRAPATSAEQLRMQSREEAKRKLQDAMEGKRAAKPAPLLGRGRSGSAPAAPPPPRDPNQVLLDQIVGEIEERTAFLDAMRARGDESHTETIKGEIAARLRDIRQLERIIAEEEADRAAATASLSQQQSGIGIGGQRRASPSPPPPLASSAAAAAGGAGGRSSAGRKR